MSNAVFPSFVGLKWDRERVPTWSTMIEEAVSGRETRIGLWTYPRWRWTLSYEFLRSGSLYNEWQQLLGFFLARKGALDSWLYEDPEDMAVIDQTIGVGDGQTVAFQLIRSLGGFDEPIIAPKGTPAVYIDDVAQPSGWSLGSCGIITFTAPPSVGAVITVDMSYYWRVRFLEDELELSNFMYKFWELKKVEFVSLKP